GVGFIFSLLFKFLPETDVAWKDVVRGGFVTAFLFMLGKYAIGLYLGNSSVGASFGAAGSLAVLLVWIYYSAQILFFGAEFTQVYANLYGSKIHAGEHAPENRESAAPVEAGPHTGGASFHRYPGRDNQPVRQVIPYSVQLLPQYQKKENIPLESQPVFLENFTGKSERRGRRLT
ncbi:MAG: YihY/virulence factor BrkB family protein, partial [Anaerolineaceae bacterium]|nr:YihY/virulence factor BrkB family protein [Anaerolineaceae bacterium]